MNININPSNFPDNQDNSFDLKRVYVIIPALNEEATIADVITSLQSYGLSKICVVDNGSQDSTFRVAQEAKTQVVKESKRGYGQACWRGLQEIPEACDWILFCDADGSDDLSQLPAFFAATAQADLILGNRRATKASRGALTPVQNFGNALATSLIGLGWGYWYKDLGPLRLIRRSSIEQIQMQDRSFGWTVEMQVRAIECGLNICEIDVDYWPRQGGNSKISGTITGSFRAGSIIISTLGKLYCQHLGISKIQNSSLALWVSFLLLLLGVILTIPYGNFRQTGIVPHFWLGIGVMSLGFVYSWTLSSVSRLWFWGMTILTRLLMLLMYPGDDIWRYLWEGYIQNLGFSPYEFAPSAPELIPFQTPWWQLINHLDTSAIYPPLAQLGFRFLAFLTPSVLLFKLSFALADLAICWLLSKTYGYNKTLLYAWNPLIIYSFSGGGHYDSWFILPLVAAWLAFEENQWQKSSLLIGLSIPIKWMSLPILAFLVLRLRLHQMLVALLLGILPLFTTALLFCHDGKCPLIPTDSVFVSHGRSAEFIPYLLGLIWSGSKQYNWIHALPLALVILILLRFCRSFVSFTQWYFFALLSLSPIVHAWYFTWLIPWAVVTRNLGTRWVSISAFIYFVLQNRKSDWTLTPTERYWLWLPLIVGFLWTEYKPKYTNLLKRC